MWIALLCIALLVFVAACAQKPAEKPAEKPKEAPKTTTLTWTAGSMGGGWYSQAGGFGELMTKKNTGISLKVIPGGGVQNVPLVNKGDCEIGWGLPPLVAAAAAGEDPYTEKYTNVRGIATDLGISYFHFLVADDSPYKTIKDVLTSKKPIRITVSVVGSSDEWVFRKVMAFYGTSYDKLKANGSKIFHAGYADQATQFKDKNVDVYFTFLGLPGAAVTEASIGRPMRILEWPDDLLQALSKFNLGSGVIPAGTYPKAVNGDKDVKTATMSNCVIVNKNVPDDIVYTITKTICDNLEETKAIHPAFKVFDPSKAWDKIGAPLHPGAEKYYKEKGYIK
jgi:TRAP transporter TAXI family solute receptor